jgi:hypothetical protein
MSLIATRYCDRCEKILNANGHLSVNDGREQLDFCNWHCLLKYAAPAAKPNPHSPHLRDAVQETLPGVL